MVKINIKDSNGESEIQLLEEVPVEEQPNNVPINWSSFFYILGKLLFLSNPVDLSSLAIYLYSTCCLLNVNWFSI